MLIAITIALLLTSQVSASGWNYIHESHGGPEDWGDANSKCSGSSQSPIDVVTENVLVDHALGEFNRSHFTDVLSSVEFSNNGHTLYAGLGDAGYTLSDTNVLPGAYKLVQFHFHWGSGAAVSGSEHTFDGKRYFGELHFVHYNTKYANIGEALDKHDGLAVLGIMIEPSYPQDNLAFNRVLDVVDKIEETGSKYSASAEEMFSIETLLPCDLSMYYRYKGSLTTPPCDESVTWTVFTQPIKISRRQAEKMATKLKSTHENETVVMKDNYRPIQPINDRIVYRPVGYIKGNSAVSITSSLVSMFASIFTLLFVH